MSEKPIPFTAEMVTQILGGWKTQTRRVVKIQPKYPGETMKRVENSTDKKRIGKLFWGGESVAIEPEYFSCPYGEIGGTLWVKETYFKDADVYYYRADGTCCEQISECQCADVGKPRWKSGRFMPKKAARLFLRIKNIWVERLQDISIADIKAEGVLDTDEWLEFIEHFESVAPAGSTRTTEREYFEKRWNRIYSKKYPWDSSPFVWVIEFEVIK